MGVRRMTSAVTTCLALCLAETQNVWHKHCASQTSCLVRKKVIHSPAVINHSGFYMKCNTRLKWVKMHEKIDSIFM